MNVALQLYRRAQSLGLSLETDGYDLLIRPGGRCPPNFAAELKRHKDELVIWLDAKAAILPPDCWPWLHIAKQVLDGEFEKADRSLVDCLRIGLRNINHPLCHEALERLNKAS